ncbi:MAG: hypothetical protein E7B59_02010 [Enterobacteriaceae bacterium]|nr:hypothetical protein [Enterobacteriaceae bacterium]
MHRPTGWWQALTLGALCRVALRLHRPTVKVSGVNPGGVMPGGAALAPAYGMVAGVNIGGVMPGGAALALAYGVNVVLP